jgi:hypothetical protein
MKQIKFRIIEYPGKNKYLVQIKRIIGWKYITQSVGSNAGYFWREPVSFSTKESAINHVKFHQDKRKGRFHQFIEYPSLKIS